MLSLLIWLFAVGHSSYIGPGHSAFVFNTSGCILTTGYDVNGNICGVEPIVRRTDENKIHVLTHFTKVAELPLVYWPNVHRFDLPICVKGHSALMTFDPRADHLAECPTAKTKGSALLPSGSSGALLETPFYPTHLFLNRYCLPDTPRVDYFILVIRISD